jgi:tRNA1(Val) A37 N6-methylase TrmN6
MRLAEDVRKDVEKGKYNKAKVIRVERFTETITNPGAYGLQTKQVNMIREYRDVKPEKVFAHFDKDGKTPMDIGEVEIFTVRKA